MISEKWNYYETTWENVIRQKDICEGLLKWVGNRGVIYLDWWMNDGFVWSLRQKANYEGKLQLYIKL